MNTDLTLSAYYASPGVSLSAPEPRNLVLIYLESIETALADGDKFEKNMLAPLELATEDWQSVDVLRQYDGGGWTMAGLVGTQCGVPLRGTHVAEAGKLDVIGADSEEFMPGAVCLGDLLAREGYRNVYLGGADASFASKGVFLASHGYDEVLDLNTWLERGDDEVSAWGLSDRALMQHARETIDRLHEGGQPFNLTMLTLDTHEPAHLFEYCVPDTEVEMTSITECSMQQVAEFIKYLEDKGYLEDTVVVLMGDHERFISDGSDYQELRELEERSIFNRIWSPDTITIEREDIDQLSMFATMIEALGFTLEDHRAGVGVSATVADAPGSILDLGMYQYRDVVQSRSQDLYGLLWGSERIESDYFDPKAAQAATEG